MQFFNKPLLNCSIAGSIVIGTLAFAPLAGAANRSSTGSPATPKSAPAPTPARSAHVAFSIRLEDQLLATLRYLPVTFVPAAPRKRTTTTTTTSTVPRATTTAPVTSTTIGTSATTTTTSTVPRTTTTTRPRPKPIKILSPTALQRGRFTWHYKGIASTLRSQWRVGTNNVILQGALMHFQQLHALATTGSINTPTWQAILLAATRHQFDSTSYNYVVVSQTLPQKLMLYVNGRHVYTSFVNTGISASPTQNGTFPVYLRYVTTTMSGTNPDGSKYHDTGIPWVSYFHGGDALHGFIRSSYGSPQSLGCVEMPFANAGRVWPFTPIGTLVTVN